MLGKKHTECDDTVVKKYYFGYVHTNVSLSSSKMHVL